MISVEKMLTGLATLVVKGVIKDSWHRNFLSNVHTYVLGGNQLSTNQGAIVLKVAAKHTIELSREVNHTKTDLEYSIANPHYERQPYQSVSIKREVRYLGMDKLAFRFKLDQVVVAEIKALKSSTDTVNTNPSWNNQYRLWIVTVTPQNLDKVFGIIQRHKFEFDEEVLEYLTLCTNSKKGVTTFVPVDDQTMVVNVVANPLLSYVVLNIMNGDPV